MTELLGILQLDRGNPNGSAQIPGLIQSWFQDAGGFAALGLIAYLLYARSVPRDKSQSEKIRVPVSTWMLVCGAISFLIYLPVLIAFAVELATGRVWTTIAGIPFDQPPPPPLQPGETPRVVPPTVRTELRPILLTLGGLFAILAIGEPFVRDMFKIVPRNFTFGLGGINRFGRSLRSYTTDLLTPRRITVLVAALVVYALIGIVLFVIGVPRLKEIWTQGLMVGLGVLISALALLMLFEAEGPVWAIAKLSFKEAVRSKVLWIFMLVFIPFAFPMQWFSGARERPSDELRLLTDRLSIVLTFLSLIPAVLVASFGIPDDIKRLNIYTVVSKPVLRFEIVLGRFVGYVALMTLVMLALTGVSLVLITNTPVSEKARQETFKARVPHRGTLEFKSIVAMDRQEKKDFAGTNVGREFEYRKYITGAPGSPQRAIWKFGAVPSELKTAEGDKVPVEFTFDIYRMTKGVQNRGADVDFQFVTHNAPLRQPLMKEISANEAEWPWVTNSDQVEYKAAVDGLEKGVLIDNALANRLREGSKNPEQERQLKLANRMKRIAERLKAAGVSVTEDERGRLLTPPANVKQPRSSSPAWKAVNVLAEEFGYFELRGKEVFDYQVMGIEVPAGLFRNALATDPGNDTNGKPLPRVTVYVKCTSEGQMVGAAEPDLYLLRNELPYSVNFLKSAVGLWCQLCIVIGLAVVLSTYLSGVIGLIATACVFIAGYFTDHLSELANNRAAGGGPFQSMSQLLKAEQSTTPLTDSAGTKAILFGDKVLAWVWRRLENVFPDVDTFGWSHFVSEGFNVNTEYLVVNLLVTFGYLLPWLVLAYYLMKNREVAA